MRVKRIMLIGGVGSGKTTLAHWINGTNAPIKKTQSMLYQGRTLDVPGVYLESPWMHKHLIAASQDASQILMLVSQEARKESYPPGFAAVFRVPVIGVITTIKKQMLPNQPCVRQLQRAGVKMPYYCLNLIDQTGFDELSKILK